MDILLSLVFEVSDYGDGMETKPSMYEIAVSTIFNVRSTLDANDEIVTKQINNVIMASIRQHRENLRAADAQNKRVRLYQFKSHSLFPLMTV